MSVLRFLVAGSAALLGLAATEVADAAAAPFALTSQTFKDGTMMPKKIANTSANLPRPNANCVGENISPQFSWSGAPEGTKSYALTMFDPEGRAGLGVSHWVAYGIPADVTSFAEGEVSKASDKYVGGKNILGVGHYSGPCTPPGTPHHYMFKIVATDLDPKELQPGLTLPELEAKLSGHSKDAAGLVGVFVGSNK